MEWVQLIKSEHVFEVTIDVVALYGQHRGEVTKQAKDQGEYVGLFLFLPEGTSGLRGMDDDTHVIVVAL